MSPEQIRSPGKEDQRSDIWSVGVILYKMTTGHLPFDGRTTVSIGNQVLKSDPLAPRRLNPSVPRALETIILHCLRKDRDRRYVTPAQLADDHLVRFWDYKTGKELRTPLNHSYPVLDLAFNATGTRLVVAIGPGGPVSGIRRQVALSLSHLEVT